LQVVLCNKIDFNVVDIGMESVSFKMSVTLTFGDCAENHRNMQVIGHLKPHGLSKNHLICAKEYFENKGCRTEWFELNDLLPENIHVSESAYLLVVRKGVDGMVDSKEMLKEQEGLTPDKKAFMYGRVVNKKARYNLCFADFAQEPDYEKKQGRIYEFKSVPLLNRVRECLPEIIGDRMGEQLPCEGNYYYDTKKTYIGFHGDSERRIVIAIKLGEDFNIYYQWYHKGVKIGRQICVPLHHGDIYFMSEKAVGTDWKSRSKYTLRRAAAKNVKISREINKLYFCNVMRKTDTSYNKNKI